MLTPDVLKAGFDKGVTFSEYLAHAKPHEREGWMRAGQRAALTAAQRTVIAGFARRINVLCISGTWCGDCVQQVPTIAAIAGLKSAKDGATTPGIDLRFLERDEHKDFAQRVKICGGHRVPTVIFMNEEFDFVSILGDRTLSRYRAIAEQTLGPACPVPGAALPDDEQGAMTQEWVNEFERVALLLRLSAKLRGKHGD